MTDETQEAVEPKKRTRRINKPIKEDSPQTSGYPVEPDVCGHENLHWHGDEPMVCGKKPGHEGNHEATYKLNGEKRIGAWSDAVEIPVVEVDVPESFRRKKAELNRIAKSLGFKTSE